MLVDPPFAAIQSASATPTPEASAVWSAVFAGVGALVAIIAAAVSWRSFRVSARIAKRQALFSLDDCWGDVNEIDPAAL